MKYEPIFSVAQVNELCGGRLPEADGFDWSRVEHFKLENGMLQPYSNEEILPGPGIPITIGAPDTEKKWRMIQMRWNDVSEFLNKHNLKPGEMNIGTKKSDGFYEIWYYSVEGY